MRPHVWALCLLFGKGGGVYGRVGCAVSVRTHICVRFILCAYAQMCARMYTRIIVCAHMCVRVFVRAQRYALCLYAHRGVRMFVRVCARVFSRVLARMCARMFARVFSHTCVCVCVARVCALFCAFSRMCFCVFLFVCTVYVVLFTRVRVYGSRIVCVLYICCMYMFVVYICVCLFNVYCFVVNSCFIFVLFRINQCVGNLVDIACERVRRRREREPQWTLRRCESSAEGSQC